jgi:predicted Zn-dependent peptidase
VRVSGVHSLALHTRRLELANGLPVAIVQMPYLHTVTIVVAVRVGSRFESEPNNGISHFLEHMLFRGTAQHPSAYEFNLAVEELGGTLDAETSTELTTYKLTVPPESFGEGIALLAEIFGTPMLRNLELEKMVVREEILDGLDEDGRDVDPDGLAQRALFGTHPLGFKVVGDEATLQRFGEVDLRLWHARHYVARNASVAIAGAVDPVHAEEVAARFFGALAEGKRREPAPFAEAVRGPRWSCVSSGGSKTDVRVALPSVGARDPGKIAIDLLVRVLDDGMSTRLFRRIVEDTGLAYDTFAAFEAYEDVGTLVVGASIEHSKTAELVRAVLELLAELRDAPITEREFVKAKKRALFELSAMLDDASALAEMLATQRLMGREEDLPEIAARIEATTVEEVAAAARRTIRPDHLQVVAVGELPWSVKRESRRIVQAFR